MHIDAARRTAKELQLVGGTQTVSFHGRSMEPFLLDGDELVVEPIEWNAIKAGDIISYRLDERFPTLRVVHVSGSRLTLRGDNWPATDFTIWPEDVLGRVTKRLRGGQTLDVHSIAWRMRTSVSMVDDRLRRVKRRTMANVTRVRNGVRRRVKGRLSPLGEIPTGVQLNIAASCNLGCRMCPYLDVHDNPDYVREMSEDTFRSILPTIAHIPSLSIAGSGEPLFNKKLPDFIRQARQINPTIKISVTTNGTLLTERVSRELIDAGLDNLTVSLDGATAATASAIRIGVNFEKVLENVRTFSRIRKERGRTHPTVRANFVVGYGSYKELPAFMSMARSLGIDHVAVLEIFDGTAEAWQDNLLNSIKRDRGAVLREAKRRADAEGLGLTLPTMSEEACFHPYEPHISESGAVSPCCFVDYDTRTFWDEGRPVAMPKIEYGNVNETPFEDIWKSKPFADLRTRDRRGDFPDFCKTCQSIRACTSKAVQHTLGC